MHTISRKLFCESGILKSRIRNVYSDFFEPVAEFTFRPPARTGKNPRFIAEFRLKLALRSRGTGFESRRGGEL